MPKQKQTITFFSTGKIKKIIQNNIEIGKLSKLTTIAISKATEMFAEEIFNAMKQTAKGQNHIQLNPAHLREVIENNQKYDFLKPFVTDLPQMSEIQFTKQKRRKSESSKNNNHVQEEGKRKKKQRSK